MHANSDAGSRYLSLALLTRGAMNNLKGVVQGQAVGNDLTVALDRLLSGFRAQPAGSFLAQLQEGGPDSSFEELATLSSLYSEFQAKNVAQSFSDVLEQADVTTRGESAKKLISFLGAVESKALHYYSRAVQHTSY